MEMPQTNRVRRVLIVEDDKDLAKIIKRFLEANEFCVHAAVSAEAAYELLESKTFDCLVVDVNLPGDDGFTLCRQLRRKSGVPLLFVSARIEADARIKALEEGGDVYLPKPFSLKELLAQIKALMRRNSGTMTGGSSQNRSTEPEAPITIGPFTLDISSGRILKNGIQVELSPKEFALAAFLMGNCNKAFSKEALLSEIWGAFCSVEAQTVAVHISWLRAKLEDDPANPVFFKTVRGKGYLFDAPKETDSQ
ncbi:response regulator transcription factor [Adlercreutzia sp. ZJ154]|uniref:response regulator transcription factor n=1 Tax=Adlercreutzia sp. ZJ154 TaxID=2709790 RepID=UPI001F1566A8|nr:response regulator transcription factor [Adlercreutzia sp. ZJ154]